MDQTMNALEVADTLENLLEGRGGEWDWDNYMSATFFTDPYLQSIQERMNHLSDEFPDSKNEGFCGLQGRAVIRQYIAELRSRPSG